MPARNAQAVAIKPLVPSATIRSGSVHIVWDACPDADARRPEPGLAGLVFLSSYAFLSPQDQSDLHLDPVTALLSSQFSLTKLPINGGGLVLWSSYRDQWLMEALANYSALLVLEQQNPAQFRQALEKYRNDLLSKSKDGTSVRDAGPVTLGSD